MRPSPPALAAALLATLLSSTLPMPAAAQAAAAAQVEVAGIRYDTALPLAGSRLLLNGSGIRWRIVRVYTAGLYLGARADTLDEVLSQPGPKRLHIVMLREIDGNDLGKLFTRGMQDNADRDEFVKSIPGTVKMGELFSQKKRLVAGESFSIDWLPGTGTQIHINGKPAGEPIREPEFFSALMKIWLGSKPADAQLKDALLGIARTPTN